ncbi:mechanosensitive ion channel family protein [Winogradskyella alexanderae]|uniref:Mechanosensitive ion channel family protein n=1 Tax=Winogradskyella alexanderae TaxID=2877123 RepID=A0ABS7XV52_9FLAO|nr:mechanosensitive ion channel family protein [Winogradskyella alexanderae]MCA0133313.1 mechanosensitive ion channel family protein [Winogradskyella alexanderae]
MKCNISALITALVIFGLLSCNSLFGQNIITNQSIDSTEIKVNKTDPLGRLTPRSCIDGFFKSIANNNYLKASKYINYPVNIETDNDSIMIALVKKFEVVLNKHGKIDPVRILNNSTEGNNNDGLGLNFENVGTLELDQNTAPFLLEKVKLDNNLKIWLISSETSGNIINYLNNNINYYNNYTSTNNKYSKWLGAPALDWLAMIILALASYVLAWLITVIISFFVRSFWKNFKQSKYSRFLRALLIPLRLVFTVLIVLNISRILGLSIVVRQAFGVINLILMWTALFIFIWLLIDALSSFADDRLRERQIFSGLSAISFLKNSAKFSLIIIAILIIFETLGFNITAGIAALGVGGIALALGAQKTVENIVGGLSVVFDQPVSVGDFCKFGNTLGTVEKIGMRSTRIRTTARTVVTIPNADFSSQIIENFAKRDMFLFQTTIGLRYETSTNQMRYILIELRNLLYAHPKVDRNPARARFIGYGSDALNVELYAYILAADWNEFLAVQEDINLRIAEVVESSGSGFAFPSQTVYLSKDQGLSESKKKAAEEKVQKWIDDDELQMPEFDENTIVKIENTIQYPIRKSNNNSENEQKL